MEENKGQILLYQTVDGDSRIEVTLCYDTVWLTLDQMAELFQRNKSTISRHIKNVFESRELQENSVVAFFATTSLCEVLVSVLKTTIIFVSPVVTLSKLVILPRPAKSSKPKKGLILLLKGIQNSSHVLPSKSLAIFFVSGIVL